MFTWIITHILFSLPVLFWVSMAMIGFIVYFISGYIGKIPVLNIQAGLIRIIGVIAMVIGVFMWGGSGVAAIYKAQIEEQKEKIRIAEAKSQKVNVIVEEKIVEKIKYIRGKTEYITRYVDKEIIKYDTKFVPGGACEIPKEFIRALNAGAKNNTDELKAAIGGIKDSTRKTTK